MSRDVTFLAWRPGTFDGGTHQGTVPGPRGLGYGETAGTRRYGDPHGSAGPRDYAWTGWVSPAVLPGHRFTSLIASWNARTPGDSWIEVEARVSADGVSWSRWRSLGRWAETDTEIHSSSVAGQIDETVEVRTDVLQARGQVSWSSYQLRVSLHRRRDSDAVPTVSMLGAVAAGPPDPDTRPGTSEDRAPGVAHGIELPVPTYSQQLHRGEYPHWDSGGESWCSPTSTTMVLGTWGLGPDEEEYAWVDETFADRFVDHAARRVFDHAYGGAGNWAFNTAYAARYGTEAFVTRLRSLAEAERFVEAGIPLVATVSFEEDGLAGAGYGTTGHLLAIVGFDEAGGVVSNDPASHKIASNDEVRVVFDRSQFEKVWQAAGGVVYVIHPPDVPLPEPPAQPNW